MSNHIFQSISNLLDKYQTRDPFEVLDALHASVRETDKYDELKGFCYVSRHRAYILINAALDDVSKAIVAAHELGHLLLHTKELQGQVLFDNTLYNTSVRTEYEANIFAADFLLSDEDVIAHCNDASPDVFSMARAMHTQPELLNLKILSMKKRGYEIRVPLPINNLF